jgi:hypothetical protein
MPSEQPEQVAHLRLIGDDGEPVALREAQKRPEEQPDFPLEGLDRIEFARMSSLLIATTSHSENSIKAAF